MKTELIFRNSLGKDYVFRNIISLSGFDSAAITHITTASSGQDGETYVSSYLSPREMEITFDIFADASTSVDDIKRNILCKLSPKNGVGQLYYKKGLTGVVISCVFNGITVTKQCNTIQTVLVRFTAFQPYFSDTVERRENLKFVKKQLVFPVTFPCTFGMRTNTGTLINSGDAPAPVIIRFYGGVTGPTFYNRTTGEFIGINGTISDDEILEIDTTHGIKSITLISGNTRENAFSMLNPRSQLWALLPGENEIEYTCESDNDDSYGEIVYYNRYVGV